jgi:hypothetical protein
VTSTVQPAMAAAVAISQRKVSAGPPVRRLIRPVNTGALPMASTVPMATPVSLTAEKKQSW